MSILRRGAVVREVTLLRPAITVARETPQRYSISDLLESEPSPPPPPEQQSSPTRYSINNIRILEGSIDFIDRPMHQTHTVRHLTIAMPFVSNLPYDVELDVQPAFSASFDGTVVSLGGRTKPFSHDRETLDRSRRSRAVAGALLRIRAGAAALHAALGGARRRADGAVRAARLGEADADAVGPRVAEERGVARSRRRAAVRAGAAGGRDRAVGAVGGTADAGTRSGRFADGVGAAAAQRAHEPRRPHAAADASRGRRPGRARRRPPRRHPRAASRRSSLRSIRSAWPAAPFISPTHRRRGAFATTVSDLGVDVSHFSTAPATAAVAIRLRTDGGETVGTTRRS